MSLKKKVPTHLRSVVSSHAERGRHGDTANKERIAVGLGVARGESGDCA
ncbi:hypothetical protein [Burkholderia sp. Tr-862]|nr:hypothetical protein [Burkholderia sp. Tr-862]